jgi:hypothetical protein
MQLRYAMAFQGSSYVDARNSNFNAYTGQGPRTDSPGVTLPRFG